MHIKQLRALLTIADTGSVTKAAELLNIVQPAVSRQLRLLEEDLGCELFERGRHGMELTDAGKILVEYARRALRELDRARSEIQPLSGVGGISVAIGLIPSTSKMLAAPLMRRLSATHPEIGLRLSTGYTGHLQDWLKSGDLDAALLYDPKPSPEYKVEPMLTDKLWLIGPPSERLVKGTPVPLAQLGNKPLILPSAPHGIRSLIERACAVAGIHLSVIAETNDMNVQKGLVAGGLGFTVLPGIAVAEDIAAGTLSGAPLIEPEIQRRIVLALPTNRRTSAAARVVVTSLMETMKEALSNEQWSDARWLGL